MRRQLSPSEEMYIKTVPIDNPADVQGAVVESVCTSIVLASSADNKLPRKQLEIVLDRRDPDWKLLEALDSNCGRRLSWGVPSDVAECFSSSREARASQVEFIIHSEPFEAGVSRKCFWGICRSQKSMGWKRMVFKQFLERPGRYDDYEAEVEKALVAEFLAGEFNKACKSQQSIRFLVPDVIEDKQSGGAIYIVEDILPDHHTFTKYNDNKASWVPNVYDPVLGDFCSWAYAFSAGKLMAVDLQGVLVDGCYTLTDPASRHAFRQGCSTFMAFPLFFSSTKTRTNKKVCIYIYIYVYRYIDIYTRI